MTSIFELINILNTIQEGVTFMDGVTVDNGDFEEEIDFVDAIVSEFVHRLGLDTDRDIYAPGDGQVSTAIKALGWRLRMQDNINEMTFDQTEHVVWVPSAIVERGNLRVAGVYALIGLYFLEKTQEGQALMNSASLPMMPGNAIMDPAYPGGVVKEIATDLSKDGVIPRI